MSAPGAGGGAGALDGADLAPAGAGAAPQRGRAREWLSHPGIRRIATNTGWLVGERITQMALGLFVSVWMARYLGPAQFGMLSYAISLVGLFGFMSYLGLTGIVTRDLVLRPQDRAELLGTTLALRVCGGAAGAAAIIAFSLLRPGGDESRWLLLVLGAGMVLDGFEVVDLWFQSRVRSKVSSIVRTASLAAGAAAKIALILAGAPLVAFAVAIAGQQALKAALFLTAYARDAEHPAHWRFSGATARRLLRQSWPLILSSVGSLIYLKIDQVMLGEMVGAAEVGVYAVAARVSEVWYFIPVTVATSIFPSMIQARETDAAAYGRRLQHAFNLVAWMGLGIAVLVTLLAGPVVKLLFGPEYHASAAILALHVWTCPAVFLGAILSRWLVAEGLMMFSLTRHGLGAVANVVLNLLLIPRMGAAGAAIATLVSYTLSSWLACYTDRRTLPAARMMTRALASPVTGAWALARKWSARAVARGREP